jgi:hypothetical protein
MRWVLGVTFVLLGSCGFAFSQTVVLPSEVKTAVGEPTRIKAKTDGKHVQWVAKTAGLMVFPAELLKESTTGVVWANKPGRYWLIAYTAKDDTPSPPAECVVVVGDPGPGPDPEPDPQPTPDVLLRTLRDAYAVETDPQKARLVKSLASLYRVVGQGEVPETTWGELYAMITNSARTLELTGKIPVIQKAVSTELQAILPVNPIKDPQAPLTPDNKVVIKAAFLKVAKALEMLP